MTEKKRSHHSGSASGNSASGPTGAKADAHRCGRKQPKRCGRGPSERESSKLAPMPSRKVISDRGSGDQAWDTVSVLSKATEPAPRPRNQLEWDLATDIAPPKTTDVPPSLTLDCNVEQKSLTVGAKGTVAVILSYFLGTGMFLGVLAVAGVEDPEVTGWRAWRDLGAGPRRSTPTVRGRVRTELDATAASRPSMRS